MRPDVGTQAQFKKKMPPKVYSYDSSLSPSMEWDGQNPAREMGEAHIQVVLDGLYAAHERLAKLKTADVDPKEIDKAKAELEKSIKSVQSLKAMSKPFLNWAGKAEHLSFDVPTLPLFVHERLSTQAILQTLKGHKRDKQESFFDELFKDPEHSITDQVLKCYEYQDDWVNRMILGDSLVVMNSLLHYENMGSKVQMIYMDPPYGVKFGSNFQPFVRKRDVGHGDDEDMTREPEMVQAYRDTWELGLHSYLTYMRDRLKLSRELLTTSGSIFVQISEENLHHVRELMDEVFDEKNFISIITFSKTTGFSGKDLSSVADYILWYAKDSEHLKYNQLFRTKEAGDEGATKYRPVETIEAIPKNRFLGDRLATSADLTSQGESEGSDQEFEFQDKKWNPPSGLHWKTTVEGLKRLAEKGRIIVEGNSLRYIRFMDDFPVFPISNVWTDIGGIQNRSEGKLYVVQTATLAILRCLLMTTEPGDLVLDPTCGSGTTAFVAEQWGRRWITADVSRVPLALARQRLLTSTYPWFELKDENIGPVGGFAYKRKRNNKGEEVGGVVPHITLKSIANNEPPPEEVIVDRPEEKSSITRVSGPFTFEAMIPTALDATADISKEVGADNQESYGSYVDRMLEVLRRSPKIHLPGNKTVSFKNVRPPAKSLSLSAEGLVVNGSEKPVALVFGPENGAVSEKLVFAAAKEAEAKKYSHLYVFGFAIQPNARQLVEKCDEVVGISATYVQSTPDLMMGDLLKNMRSSQIFSVCGLPEIKVKSVKGGKYQVELVGLDVFDPITMKSESKNGNDVPAWFLDTDYNDLSFHVCQAFFPRTSAWENLKKALKVEFEESVWDHLAGTVSTPFEPGDHKQIAVKVIDDRGNELMVVHKLNGKNK